MKMRWENVKLGLFSAGAGIGLLGGSASILWGDQVIGVLAFLLGVWNLYFMLLILDLEEMKAREFTMKYPGFALLLIEIMAHDTAFGSFMIFSLGLLMVYVGLDARRKRFNDSSQ